MIVGVLAGVGFFLSLYGLHVQRYLHSAGYVPLCDFSSAVSCSRALGSDTGRLLGFSNSLLGLIFYLLVFVFFLLEMPVLALSLPALLFSLFLMYNLYKLRTVCVVCFGVYLVNMLLVIFSF